MSIAQLEREISNLRCDALALAFDGDQVAAQFTYNQAAELQQLLDEARAELRVSEK